MSQKRVTFTYPLRVLVDVEVTVDLGTITAEDLEDDHVDGGVVDARIAASANVSTSEASEAASLDGDGFNSAIVEAAWRAAIDGSLAVDGVLALDPDDVAGIEAMLIRRVNEEAEATGEGVSSWLVDLLVARGLAFTGGHPTHVELTDKGLDIKRRLEEVDND